jgi:hypothetical protein
MKKVTANNELEPNKDYIVKSKMIYDNGKRSDYINILGAKEIDRRKYFGDHIWAMDKNNKTLLTFEYHSEEVNDIQDDIIEALDELVTDVDEYGLFKGKIKITVDYIKEDIND